MCRRAIVIPHATGWRGLWSCSRNSARDAGRIGCDKDDAGEENLRALEARNLPYLFKLRMSKNVQPLVRSLWAHDDWSDAGQGWPGRQSTIRLHGWSRQRRIVVLPGAVKEKLALEDTAQ